MTEKYIVTGNREEVAPVYRALGKTSPAAPGKYELHLTRAERDRVLLRMNLDGINGTIRRQLNAERKADAIFKGGYTRRCIGTLK